MKWILQLCHSYGAPFDDVARQWKVLFDGTEYKVLTVFLTGQPSKKVVEMVGGEVKFLNYSSKDIKGLKRAQVKAIRALDVEYDFRLAVAHRYKSMYIATHVKGLRVFGVAHAYGVFDRFWRRRYVQSCKGRLTLVGVSNVVRDDIRRSLPKYPQEKVQTIYNRVDVDRLRSVQLDKGRARELLGLSQDAYIFGSVGRLHPDKDPETIISGFAKASLELDDALLVLVGDGRLESELKQQAIELGVKGKVLFLGRVEDAKRYFKAFDSFVLASNNEAFGLVLLEAMAAGVDVAYSKSGGFPEVMGPLGEPFSAKDCSSLSKALKKLYSSRKDCQEEWLVNRVESHFSDKIMRDVFWSHPVVKAIFSCNPPEK